VLKQKNMHIQGVPKLNYFNVITFLKLSFWKKLSFFLLMKRAT